jgi:hypothetical protein
VEFKGARRLAGGGVEGKIGSLKPGASEVGGFIFRDRGMRGAGGSP